MIRSSHDQESESIVPASIDPAHCDPLSDVLETIRLRGALFFLWQPSWPFGVGVADGQKLCRHIVPGTDCVISYHIVTKGPCWAAVHGEPPLRLETGEILVLPRGDAYKIADKPLYPSATDETASIEFFKSMARGEIAPLVTDGGPGPGESRLICGFLGCNLRPFNPLLSTLPRMIRIPAPADARDPLTPLIEFALSESNQSRGGERCLLMRLSEVMFVEVLRRYLRLNSDFGGSWMDGLTHPVVGRALALLHRDLAHPWTLRELAQRSGASRSTLAEQFNQIIGTPPMQYLTHWRMQAAATRLLDRNTKVYTVACEVGYESEAAFSRAFKRVVGQTPTAWRDRKANAEA